MALRGGLARVQVLERVDIKGVLDEGTDSARGSLGG